MSNIFLRAITGLFFISLMISATQFPAFQKILVCAFAGLCVYELFDMFGFKSLYKLTISTITVLTFINIIYIHDGIIENISIISFSILLMLIIFLTYNQKIIAKKSGKIIIGGFIYIIFSIFTFGELFYLNLSKSHGLSVFGGCFDNTMILSTLIFIWTNDTFAYLIGRKIGKTPLAPIISPKKTIEGTLGGLLCTILAAFILKNIYDIPEGKWFYIYALLISVSATIGDLIESIAKRTAGVKDSGKLLPGHGGFLDRLDAMLFSCLMAYLFFNFVSLF